MKKYIVIKYEFGIFKNYSIEEFIELMLLENPKYDLFQILENRIWTPAGFENSREFIFKLKI